MKKLINDPRDLVRECLEGVADLSRDLGLLADENVIVTNIDDQPEKRPVSVISGGGSGHEPAHAGYVGAGMLTAAVAGDVFTSPSVDAVLSAIRAVSGPAGCVLIVKNYTGDRLNFGLAAEIATNEGIPTRVVVVADDVSLAETVTKERRRGIAGTVLIHKLAGAMAADGYDVDTVADFAAAAATDLGTMGVALGACTVPAAGKPGFELGEDEIELGLGIHGEKGVRRTKMQPADDIVETLLAAVVADLDIAAGEPVCLLVNGLGGTPPIELSIVARSALANLRARGIDVQRAWSGTLLSALEMPGFSVSLMKLDRDRLAALDHETTAMAWPCDGRIAGKRRLVPKTGTPVPEHFAGTDGPLSQRLQAAGAAISDALTKNEALFTDLDQQAGDGDLGDSMMRGARALTKLNNATYPEPAAFLMAMAHTLRRAIAGSSGPFYAIALARAARVLEGVAEPTTEQWADAFEQAVLAVEELGGAKPGDRTMVDALRPAVEAFRANADGKAALKAAASAARAGADATAQMRPALGRASYLGDRAIGIKDGGAEVVAVWLSALAKL